MLVMLKMKNLTIGLLSSGSYEHNYASVSFRSFWHKKIRIKIKKMKNIKN